MIGYKGKTPHLRQYMPQKHHARFGIKVWCLCDYKTGYTCTFEVYKGRNVAQDAGGGGVIHNLVVRLLRQANVLYRGHHVGMDSYFSSPKLFFELYKARTLATGTVRTHKKGLPRQCVTSQLGDQQVCERRKGPLLCVAYKDKSRKPTLLSTVAKAGYVEVTNRRGQIMRKPEIVTIYNRVMGGVDSKDTRLYAYLAERRTMKWSTKVFFSLLGHAVLNSYILYKGNTSAVHIRTRHDYMISLVHSLVKDYRLKKSIVIRRTREQIRQARARQDDIRPPMHAVASRPNFHNVKKLANGTRRNCGGGHARRTRTVWECSSCHVSVCRICIGKYHS